MADSLRVVFLSSAVAVPGRCGGGQEALAAAIGPPREVDRHEPGRPSPLGNASSPSGSSTAPGR